MIDLKQKKILALKAIKEADQEKLEELRIAYLSKKGEIAALMAQMRDLSASEKPIFGAEVNDLKKEITLAIEEKSQEIKKSLIEAKMKNERVDISLDAFNPNMGTLHPLSMVEEDLADIFLGMGYKIAEGPEIESDEYNFTRANTPAGHPARDMQDTFYLDPTHLLRSQTTAIQMRVLESDANNLPIKVICPGKTYRRDDDDATHSHQFRQCEGLVVGKNITVTDLKGTLELMIRELFSPDTKIRFRPSYFPFTEPSFEVDMTCHICKGKGCPTCKGTGYIEILGSGMVHPNVLKMANIDPDKYSGFAFGVGIERIAMLKYGITDIRDLYTNDLRFLKGFGK